MKPLSAIQGTKAIPATPTDLATLFGLDEDTLFSGYYAYPDTNASNVTETATTGNSSTDVPAAPGTVSPDYVEVNLSTIVISGTATDSIVIKGQRVPK